MAQASTTKRQTTEERNGVLSISIPQTIIDRLKKRADVEMRTVSSMAAYLLSQALQSTEN